MYKYGLHQYLRKAQQDLHSLVMGLVGNHQYIYPFTNMLLAQMAISSGLLSILNLQFYIKATLQENKISIWDLKIEHNSCIGLKFKSLPNI